MLLFHVNQAGILIRNRAWQTEERRSLTLIERFPYISCIGPKLLLVFI